MLNQKNDRVRASVNPTNRIIAERARDSSGRFPLYNIESGKEVIYFSVFAGARSGLTREGSGASRGLGR